MTTNFRDVAQEFIDLDNEWKRMVGSIDDVRDQIREAKARKNVAREELLTKMNLLASQGELTLDDVREAFPHKTDVWCQKFWRARHKYNPQK